MSVDTVSANTGLTKENTRQPLQPRHSVAVPAGPPATATAFISSTQLPDLFNTAGRPWRDITVTHIMCDGIRMLDSAVGRDCCEVFLSVRSAPLRTPLGFNDPGRRTECDLLEPELQQSCSAVWAATAATAAAVNPAVEARSAEAV